MNILVLASQQAALLLSKQPCFSASSLASQQAVLLLSKQSSLASQQAVLLVLLGRLLLSSLLLSLIGFKVDFSKLSFSSFLRFFLCPEEDAAAFSACKHKKNIRNNTCYCRNIARVQHYELKMHQPHEEPQWFPWKQSQGTVCSSSVWSLWVPSKDGSILFPCCCLFLQGLLMSLFKLQESSWNETTILCPSLLFGLEFLRWLLFATCGYIIYHWKLEHNLSIQQSKPPCNCVESWQ